MKKIFLRKLLKHREHRYKKFLKKKFLYFASEEEHLRIFDKNQLQTKEKHKTNDYDCKKRKRFYFLIVFLFVFDLNIKHYAFFIYFQQSYDAEKCL